MSHGSTAGLRPPILVHVRMCIENVAFCNGHDGVHQERLA
jgi:hypothetical protein